MDVLKRFEAKTDRSGDCWLWTGHTLRGYPRQIMDDYRRWMVSHWALMHYRGIEVPPGMETDHLCHTAAVAAGTCDGGDSCPHRSCVNPWHLEVVSRSENQKRRARTSCRRGHPYTPENTTFDSGKRRCRVCQKIRNDARHRRSSPA